VPLLQAVAVSQKAVSPKKASPCAGYLCRSTFSAGLGSDVAFCDTGKGGLGDHTRHRRARPGDLMGSYAPSGEIIKGINLESIIFGG
jgi:hypothetical protein